MDYQIGPLANKFVDYFLALFISDKHLLIQLIN
jgi:hypothetical protein